MEKNDVIKEFLSSIGKIGGSVKSQKKAISSAKNGRLGGRPKVKNNEKNK